MQSVQRQVQTLIDRKGAYTMRVLLDLKNIPLVTTCVVE